MVIKARASSYDDGLCALMGALDENEGLAGIPSFRITIRKWLSFKLFDLQGAGKGDGYNANPFPGLKFTGFSVPL